MAMVHCRGCGKEIHESAQTCPLCGAPQAVAGGMKGVAITSYDQVPWFRKRLGAGLIWLIFAPAYVVIAFTGEIYYQQKGELKTVGVASKIIFSVLWLFFVGKAIFGN